MPTFKHVAIVAWLTVTSSSTFGHPPNADDTSETQNHGNARATSPYPPAIVLPQLDGPAPWSDKPVLNDPDRFQIAIMTDRTGPEFG